MVFFLSLSFPIFSAPSLPSPWCQLVQQVICTKSSSVLACCALQTILKVVNIPGSICFSHYFDFQWEGAVTKWLPKQCPKFLNSEQWYLQVTLFEARKIALPGWSHLVIAVTVFSSSKLQTAPRDPIVYVTLEHMWPYLKIIIIIH